MKNCDFVVVSAALNDETKFIVNRYRIGLMKPNAILVNIGRGGLYFVIKLFYCEITNNYYKKELKKKNITLVIQNKIHYILKIGIIVIIILTKY